MNRIDKLINIVGIDNVLQNEPMKNHTTFRIGGPATIMVLPSKELEIKDIINLCKEEKISYTIIGNGSNLLVSDNGISGVVIKIADNFAEYEIKEQKVWAQAGIRLTALSRRILESELSGFEFASGIPGTIGGAVYMNAGAYDGDMKTIVKSVKVIDAEGNIMELSKEEMKFGYRSSIAMDKNYIILAVELELKKGNKDEIKSKIEEFTKRRNEKQPITEFSAGSTFKRPPGYFAGKLIEDAGLRGYTKGQAKVSEKHCGFVINIGDATFEEMMEFLNEVKTKVYNNSGVKLEEEVRIIGDK